MSSLPNLYERVVVPTTRLVIPGLIAKRTTLRRGKTRLNFQGLFTTRDLPAYAFLGYYTGHFYDEVWEDEDVDEVDDPPPHSRYALNGSGYTVIPPGEDTVEGVDPRTYPMAMLNEPPRGTSASVGMVEWSKAKDAVPGIDGRRSVGVLAMHTCRAVKAGEELFFHYGDQYDRRHYGRRPYNLGTPCAINRSRVPPEERPRQAMLRHGVAHIPREEAYVILD